TQIGRKLPAMTQSLLDISAFLRMHGVEIAVGLVVLIVVSIAIYSSQRGRMIVDRIMLRLPIVGYLFRLGATALVSRALAILLESGVTLLEALKTIETLPHNRYLCRRLTLARDNVIQGGTLADGIRDNGAFLPMLPAMVAVGESAG